MQEHLLSTIEVFLLACDLRISGDEDAPPKEDKGPRLRAVEAA